MSELQRAWAQTKMNSFGPFNEKEGVKNEETEGENDVSELADAAEKEDDFSSASSASSASSTGTIIPSPSQNLFARPGYLNNPGPVVCWPRVPHASLAQKC